MYRTVGQPAVGRALVCVEGLRGAHALEARRVGAAVGVREERGRQVRESDLLEQRGHLARVRVRGEV